MPERRRNKRHKPDKHLKIFDHISNEQIGLLANISVDGAMFVTKENIKPSSALICRIELLHPIMDKNVIVFKAHHRWSRKNVAERWWESGYKIETTEINKELLSYLSISFGIEEWKIPGVKEVITTPAENMRKTDRYDVKDRYPVYQKLSYHEIGELFDLSRIGASFITPEYVEPGSTLSCKVKLPRTIFQQDYLFFDAECRWCIRFEDMDMYRSGYKLLNISKKDEVIILYLMQNFLKKQKTEPRFNIVG